MKGKTQIATSIRQRLLNLARERGEDFQQLLVSYPMDVPYKSPGSTAAKEPIAVDPSEYADAPAPTATLAPEAPTPPTDQAPIPLARF